MKEIIEDIRIKLNNKSYKDEQHVRFSLVGRICQALGWDIWDPEEFYSEYRVKKFPPQDVTKDITGKVDVALFLADKQSGTSEVFIEVKAPGKMDYELEAGQTQLQRYNFYDKSVISILTDGIKWRFYLPRESGTFEDTLINEINIITDHVDSIIDVFQVLKRDNYRKKALQIAEDMHEELSQIKLVNRVKSEAQEISNKTGISKFTIASQLLKNQHKANINDSIVELLWDRITSTSRATRTKTPNQILQPQFDSNNPEKQMLRPFINSDFVKKKPKKVFVIDTWYDVNSWSDVKAITFGRFLDKLIDAKLPKACSVSKNPDYFQINRREIEKTGYYIDINFGSVSIVSQCKRVVREAGYDPDRDWGFELSEMI